MDIIYTSFDKSLSLEDYFDGMSICGPRNRHDRVLKGASARKNS